jgi:hypothetical protein
MPIVQETLVDPAGNPLKDVAIEVLLIASTLGDGNAAGFVPSDQTTVIGRWRFWTAADGAWSADLEANSLVEPDNSYYKVTRKGASVKPSDTFIVPNGAGPYWLYDILAVAPADGPQPAAYLSDVDPLALAATAAEGVATKASRDDHVHPWTGLLLPGATVPNALGSASNGSGSEGARANHVHPTTGLSLSSHTHSGVYDPAGTAASAVATHSALTTGIHGIADTAQLARLNVVQTFTAKQTFSAPISADRTIDLTAPQSTGMQAVFNRTNPPVASPQAFWNIGAMVNSQGAWLSNAWMVISGTAPGSPNAAGIYEPQQPSSDQFMLGIWSDIVGPALVTRTNPTSTPGYNYQAHDRNGNYVFSVEEDGTLKWGATDRAGMGTSLYRSAVATLRTPGTLAIDTLLTFPTSGTRSLITARNQGNSATLVALSVDASNNLVIGDGATPWAGVLVNKSKLTLQGSAATGWQSATAFYGGDANNNSGATADFAIGSGLAGGRLYAGRWSSTDRGTRLVSLNSVGAEKTYLHLNGEGGSVALGVGIGSTAGNGTDRIKVDGTGIGFFAATPVAKPTLAAAATDLATALTLVNDIRTRLINYGLAA